MSHINALRVAIISTVASPFVVGFAATISLALSR